MTSNTTSILLSLALLHLTFVALCVHGVYCAGDKQATNPDQQALMLMAQALRPSGQLPLKLRTPTDNWCKDWFNDDYHCTTIKGTSYLIRLNYPEVVVDYLLDALFSGINNDSPPGQLPTGAFSRVESAYIKGEDLTNVTGTIPQWLLQLPKLDHLTISDTSMGGPLPEVPPAVCNGKQGDRFEGDRD